MTRGKWIKRCVFVAIALGMVVSLSACPAPPSPTPSPSPTPTISPSPSPTVSPSPSPTVSPTPLGSVEVLGVWGGDELASFEAMVAPWEEQTGGTMEFTGTRDLIAILTTRVEAGNPPDVAILPNPGQMVVLAREGDLVPLSSFMDMQDVADNYPEAWIELGMVDDEMYAIFMKATDKSTVWYNPGVFDENDWEVPGTWDAMISLSDEIATGNQTPANPWSVALESAETSGWPGTDWIQQIVLSEYGSEVYDQWVNHEIPWTDERIKAAWEKFGTIVLTEDYVPGGATAALATNFVDGSYLPFEDPPQAAMYFLGDFTQGFIAEQFPDLQAGEDYSFFPFPTITEEFAGAVTGGGDVVVIFNDNPTVRSFVEYLASADAQQIWVERGGFTSVNQNVPLEAYPNELARSAAEQLLGASLFRFDADDLMPPAVATAYFDGILQYVQNPDELDDILQNIEDTAVDAYGES